MDARQEPMDTSRPSDPVEVPMSSRRIGRSSTDSGFGSFGAPFPAAPSRFSTPGTSASSSRSSGSISTWFNVPMRAIATQTSRSDDHHAFVFDTDDAVFENVGSDTQRLPSALLPDVVPRNGYDHFNNSHNRNSNGHGQDLGNGLGRVARAHSVTLPLPPNFDDVMSQRARDMGRTLRRLSKEFDHAGPVNQGCQQRRATSDGVYNEEEGGIWQIVRRPWMSSPPPQPRPSPSPSPENNPPRPNRLPLMRIRSQSESDAEPPTPTFDNGRR